MKRYKVVLITLAAAFSLGLSSCVKDLDVEPIDPSITLPEDVLNTEEAFLQVLAQMLPGSGLLRFGRSRLLARHQRCRRRLRTICPRPLPAAGVHHRRSCGLLERRQCLRPAQPVLDADQRVRDGNVRPHILPDRSLQRAYPQGEREPGRHQRRRVPDGIARADQSRSPHAARIELLPRHRHVRQRSPRPRNRPRGIGRSGADIAYEALRVA